jgi:hypothetical protein
MIAPARHPPPLRARRQVWAALWLSLALLFQGLLMAHQATAMASGDEVCTADGAQRRGPDGRLLVQAGHAGHDGCCSASLAMAPAPAALPGPGLTQPAASRPLSAGRIGSARLAPQSRGPPAA